MQCIGTGECFILFLGIFLLSLWASLYLALRFTMRPFLAVPSSITSSIYHAISNVAYIQNGLCKWYGEESLIDKDVVLDKNIHRIISTKRKDFLLHSGSFQRWTFKMHYIHVKEFSVNSPCWTVGILKLEVILCLYALIACVLG